MSRSEVLSVRGLTRAPSARATRQLPLHVEPLPEEALISWLPRLAARLEISMQALEQEGLGISSKGGREQWWRRPDAWVLKRISDATGVGVKRLRQMTLQDWPIHQGDEVSDRFNEHYYAAWTPQWRAFRYVVCEQCLRADKHPYLRLVWTIGWVAVCPTHGTVMTTTCSLCRSKLHMPCHSSTVSFSALGCTVCGDTVRFTDFRAHPTVTGLQEALLRGKRRGTTELEGQGRVSWSETVALWDNLARRVRRTLRFEERMRLYRRFEQETQVRRFSAPNTRYADLAFFGWLIGQWRGSTGGDIGPELLSGGRPLERPI